MLRVLGGFPIEEKNYVAQRKIILISIKCSGFKYQITQIENSYSQACSFNMIPSAVKTKANYSQINPKIKKKKNLVQVHTVRKPQ